MKSSVRTWMHIFSRRSSKLSMSHALAWQTTSRSFGFTNSERSQNVFGSGAKPSDSKKPWPYFTMPMASTFFAFSSSVMSYGGFCCGGATMGKMLPHSCAQGLPSRSARILPSASTAVGPYFSTSLVRTYACSES